DGMNVERVALYGDTEGVGLQTRAALELQADLRSLLPRQAQLERLHVEASHCRVVQRQQAITGNEAIFVGGTARVNCQDGRGAIDLFEDHTDRRQLAALERAAFLPLEAGDVVAVRVERPQHTAD